MGFGTQGETTRQAGHSSPGIGRSFHVRIDELVLHGFARADRHRIAHALELELTRLISDGPLQGFGKSASIFERVDGGAFQLKAGAKPEAAGTEIARAVFRSLRQARTLLGSVHPGFRSSAATTAPDGRAQQ
jgi:hypothetical protein